MTCAPKTRAGSPPRCKRHAQIEVGGEDKRIFCSGRPGANRRHSAWETDCKLQTKNISVFVGFILAIEYRLFSTIPFSRFLMVFRVAASIHACRILVGEEERHHCMIRDLRKSRLNEDRLLKIGDASAVQGMFVGLSGCKSDTPLPGLFESRLPLPDHYTAPLPRLQALAPSTRARPKSFTISLRLRAPSRFWPAHRLPSGASMLVSWADHRSKAGQTSGN